VDGRGFVLTEFALAEHWFDAGFHLAGYLETDGLHTVLQTLGHGHHLKGIAVLGVGDEFRTAARGVARDIQKSRRQYHRDYDSNDLH
jgi:hypothetical protein